MSKITVGRSGRSYTLNGVKVTPRELVFVDMFKGRNHIAAWIWGKGGEHLGNFKRYIEEWKGYGVKGFRIPPEVKLWGGLYFNRPDYPNEHDFIDLNVPTGSKFRLTEGFKKQIRVMVRIAREMDVVFEMPALWTIKSRADRDPRKDVSVWNEHYIVHVSAYLHHIKTNGAGEGEHRVDPGGTNILFEVANEYRAHSDEFNDRQLQNIFERFHTRDCPGELIGISQSQPKHEYYPRLGLGARSPDDIRIHPTRDGEWENSAGDLVRRFWKHNIPIFANESIMHMTQSQWNEWLGKIPKWHGLATTNARRFMQMHRNFWERGIYSTLHTFRGMDGGWPASAPFLLEGMVREELGGGSPPPPPPPKHKYKIPIDLAYRQLFPWRKNGADPGGLEHYNALMEAGMTEANMREQLIRSDEYNDKFGGDA